MNVELRNDWFAMCLLPYKVKPQLRDKFVACLLGDELASDEEFGEMANYGVIIPRDQRPGCNFLFQGSCFHPFRPGNMVSAILSSTMRDQDNAKPLVNDEVIGYLDNRRCHECSMPCPKDLLWNSAFNGLNTLYSRMFESVDGKCWLFGEKWNDFRARFKSVIDDVPYFKGGMFAKYEPNIRLHFERMAERHYHEFENAIASPLDKENEAVADALSNVRFELVTHFMTYWEAGLYDKADA